MELRYVVVIPAYNESANIGAMLRSLAAQTVLPRQAVVVDDNSADETAKIAAAFAARHPWLKVAGTKSEAIHLPGSKVVRAFQKGFSQLDADFQVIAKLDADLILPDDYFEKNTFSLRRR